MTLTHAYAVRARPRWPATASLLGAMSVPIHMCGPGRGPPWQARGRA